MALTLLHSPGTRSLRIIWLLDEMGLDYEVKSFKYDGKYFASEAFRALSPMGKLPALIDGETTIVESTAIMDYVMDRYGPTPLKPPADHSDYGLYLQWLHMAEGSMANYLSVSMGQLAGIDPYKVSKEFDGYCRYQIEKAFGMLTDLLSDGRDFILASGFSAADISLGYTLAFAKMVGIAFPDSVQIYYDRLKMRPGMQKAIGDIHPKIASRL